MTGGTASGYAGQPSRHVSGSDLTEETRETRAIKTAGMAPSHRATPRTSKVSKTLAGQSAILGIRMGMDGLRTTRCANGGGTSKMPSRALVKK